MDHDTKMEHLVNVQGLKMTVILVPASFILYS